MSDRIALSEGLGLCVAHCLSHEATGLTLSPHDLRTMAEYFEVFRLKAAELEAIEQLAHARCCAEAALAGPAAAPDDAAANVVPFPGVRRTRGEAQS